MRIIENTNLLITAAKAVCSFPVISNVIASEILSDTDRGNCLVASANQCRLEAGALGLKKNRDWISSSVSEQLGSGLASENLLKNFRQRYSVAKAATVAITNDSGIRAYAPIGVDADINAGTVRQTAVVRPRPKQKFKITFAFLL